MLAEDGVGVVGDVRAVSVRNGADRAVWCVGTEVNVNGMSGAGGAERVGSHRCHGRDELVALLSRQMPEVDEELPRHASQRRDQALRRSEGAVKLGIDRD